MAFVDPLTVIQPQPAPNDDFMGPEFHGFINKRQNAENTVTCTACGKNMNTSSPDELRVHPALKVLECRKCFEFFHTGQFIQDEDGKDEYCLWCGDGGNLIMCNFCNHSFCNHCIRRNFSSKVFQDIKNKSEWPCFVCDDTQLLNKRRRCKKVMKQIDSTGHIQPAKKTVQNEDAIISLIEGNRRLDDLLAPMENSVGKKFETEKISSVTNGFLKKVTPITILREKENYIVQQKSVSCDEGSSVKKVSGTQSDPESVRGVSKNRTSEIDHEKRKITSKTNKSDKLMKKISELQSKYNPSYLNNEEALPKPTPMETPPDRHINNVKHRLIFENGHVHEAVKLLIDDQLSAMPNSEVSEDENTGKSPALAKLGRNVGRRSVSSLSPAHSNSPNNLATPSPPKSPDKGRPRQGSLSSQKSPNNNNDLIRQKTNFKEKMKEADACLARLTELYKDLVEDKHAFDNTSSNPMTSPSQYARFRAVSKLFKKVTRASGKLDEMKITLHARKTYLGTYRDSENIDSFSDDEMLQVEENSKILKTPKNNNNFSHSSLSDCSLPNEVLAMSENEVEKDQPSAFQHTIINKIPKIVLKKLTKEEILKFSHKSDINGGDSSSDSMLDNLDTDSSKNVFRSNKFGISDMSSTEEDISTSLTSKSKTAKIKLPGNTATVGECLKNISKRSKEEEEDSDYEMDEDDEYFSESDYEKSNNSGNPDGSDDDNMIAMNMLLQKIQDEGSDSKSDSDVENLMTRSAAASSKVSKVATDEDKKVVSGISSNEDDIKSGKGSRHPLLNKKWKVNSDSETTTDEAAKEDTTEKLRNNKRKSEEHLDATASKRPRRRIENVTDSDSNLTTDSESDKTQKLKKRKIIESRRLIINSSSSDTNESTIVVKSDIDEPVDHVISSGDETKNKDTDNVNSNDSEEEPSEQKKHKKHFPKKTRFKRLIASDSESELINVKEEPMDDDDFIDSPQKRGRRNIRKILDDDEVSQCTQRASKEEMQRRKRLEKERECEEEKEDVIVIDENSQTPVKKTITVSLKLSRDPLVEVHRHLVKNLKPHQIQGVQFLWDNIVEKVTVANSKRGSGCILAHCMGLGKTLQTVAFLHTVLMSKHLPGLRTALVLCPFGTINNWVAEFRKWLPKVGAQKSDYKFLKLAVLDLNSARTDQDRVNKLERWKKHGGVMVIGYGLFRAILNTKRRQTRRSQGAFVEQLSSPGPDILICDEGHILKNAMSHIANIVQGVNTRRRIVLTGTPLQNNMIEYHCMVSIVKPKLLGTLKEFKNRFMNPIENGQHVDSTDGDVKLMKKRAHVLHELLSGMVQRKDYTCLRAHLAPKYEYVLNVRLSDLQIRMYEKYISMHSCLDIKLKRGCLFSDFNNLLLLVCHPRCLVMAKERRENKENHEDIRKFVNDAEENAESEEEDDDSSDDSIVLISDEELQSSQAPKPITVEDIHALSGCKLRHFIEGKSGEKPNTKNRKKLVDLATKYLDINFCKTEEFEESLKSKSVQKLKAMAAEHGANIAGCAEKSDLVNLIINVMQQENKADGEWFEKYMPTQQNLAHSIVHSGKIILMLEILQGACKVGDKVVIFSQSLLTLDLIEDILKNETKDVCKGLKEMTSPYNKWYKNKDYFRLDGSTPGNLRDQYIARFNNKKDTRVRLFLISTRAGGIGINLVGANRAIVFDASWNPAHDIQSIFRIYRFGQTKPCYIYRFIAQGTMEEKIYERQVMKLSLAFRVIDEQQISRHFSAADVAELYKFEPAPKPEKKKDGESDVPTCAPPYDALLASILKSKDCVVSYHELDSLLDHQVSEELTDAERRAAWEEYDIEQNRLAATSVTPSTFFQGMPLDVLQHVCFNADEILNTIQTKLSLMKERSLQEIMVDIQIKNRTADVDYVAKLAIEHKLEQHITLRRLTALRKFVMHYGAEAQRCLQLKKALGMSTSATPNVSSNRPFVTVPLHRPIHVPSTLPTTTGMPNRYPKSHAQTRPQSSFYQQRPTRAPDPHFRYNVPFRPGPVPPRQRVVPPRQPQGVPPRARYPQSSHPGPSNFRGHNPARMPFRTRYTVPR